jgi:DNA (cytosine-5)-methyltransferase 1
LELVENQYFSQKNGTCYSFFAFSRGGGFTWNSLKRRAALPIHVYDFFCGCGGTSAGFRAAGLDIRLGIDIDPDAQRTFETNFPEAVFLRRNIFTLPLDTIAPYIVSAPDVITLFCCCAPCQPFSRQNKNRANRSTEAGLLYEFAAFVEYYRPGLIFLENVPGIQAVDDTLGPFGDFKSLLRQLEYSFDHQVIESKNYGIPQQRRRLILVASRLGPIAFPGPTHGPGTEHTAYTTVLESIGRFPAIAAGETHPEIPNHRAARLSELNLQRIRATPLGGGRFDWPEELRLNCHIGEYNGHTDVYGRMHWDRPASGLTTRCISLSNGRFGHPEQDRAISVREAASLQTFGDDFLFFGSLNSMARQIGNAVPVTIACVFGQMFLVNFDPLVANRPHA